MKIFFLIVTFVLAFPAFIIGFVYTFFKTLFRIGEEYAERFRDWMTK